MSSYRSIGAKSSNGHIFGCTCYGCWLKKQEKDKEDVKGDNGVEK